MIKGVDLEFELLQQINLKDALNYYGVYIIWEERVKNKKMYIGQGKIIKRLSDHNENKFRKVITGLIGTIYLDGELQHEGSWLQYIESVLINNASVMLGKNLINETYGCYKKLGKILDETKGLEISLRGIDPFEWFFKERGRRFKNNEKIVLINRGYEIKIQTPWFNGKDFGDRIDYNKKMLARKWKFEDQK